MTAIKPVVEAGIYLLADHLDTALAAGEDLLAAAVPAAADREAVDVTAGGPCDVSRLVSQLRGHEAVLIARLLQARRRAADLPRLDSAMRSLIELFLASTTGLLDLIEHFGDRGEDRFTSGRDPVAFLRSRRLLAEDAAALPRFTALGVAETYRVAGTIELGPLLDLVASTLDALDLRYDLYDEATAETTQVAVMVAAVEVAAVSANPGGPLAAQPPVTSGSLAAALESMREAR